MKWGPEGPGDGWFILLLYFPRVFLPRLMTSVRDYVHCIRLLSRPLLESATAVTRIKTSSQVKHSYSMITAFAFLYFVILIGLWTSPQVINALYFGKTISLTKSDKLYPYFTSKQIAVTESGSVYVVWVDNNSVYLRASNENGTGFVPIISLSDNHSNAASPQIAATKSGSVYVVWVDTNSTSGDSDIVYRASTDGGKNFGRTKTLSRDIEGSTSSLLLSSSPQIAATESGSVYVVWVDTNSASGDSDIAFRASTDGGKKFGRKGLNVDIHGSPPLLSSSPQIAATESGSFYVVWVDTNGTTGDSDIVYRASTNGGKKFGEVEILNTDIEGSTSSLLLSSSPQIAATENGRVYLVWVNKNSTTGDSDTVFRNITSGKKFGEVEILSTDIEDSISLLLSSSPQIAATENGRVHLVWVDTNSTSGDSDIVSKHTLVSDDGLKFSKSLPQNRGWYLTEKVSTPSSPQIAATESGIVYLVWVEHRLQFKENSNNGEIFGDIVSLGRGTTLPSPQIAATENGSVYVVWVDTNSTNLDKILYFKKMSQFIFDRN